MSGLAPSSGLFVESAGSGWYPRTWLKTGCAPQIDVYLGNVEVGIYSVLAAPCLPACSCLRHWQPTVSAARLLWEAVSHASIAAQTLRVLDELLVALMLVEILHTVRISIRSHVLVREPFLVMGLIASIRRMLVISLELATLAKQGAWSTEGASLFRAPMIELGLLGLLVLAFVFSITLLRRYPIVAKDVQD